MLAKRYPKKGFSILVGKLWLDTDPKVIKAGFKKGGIVPFNRDVTPKAKYEPITLQHWQTSLSKPASNLDCAATQVLPIPTASTSHATSEIVCIPGKSTVGPATGETVCISRTSTADPTTRVIVCIPSTSAAGPTMSENVYIFLQA